MMLVVVMIPVNCIGPVVHHQDGVAAVQLLPPLAHGHDEGGHVVLRELHRVGVHDGVGFDA